MSIILLLVSCQSSDDTPLSWHEPLLCVETPLNIFPPAEGTVTMKITNISDFSIDVVIENNNYWFIRTPRCSASYSVEVFTNNKWLPVIHEFLIYGTAWGPDIVPNASVVEHFYLPNYNRSHPQSSLLMEPGFYRLRRTVRIWGLNMTDAASHELVAEFYIR